MICVLILYICAIVLTRPVSPALLVGAPAVLVPRGLWAIRSMATRWRHGSKRRYRSRAAPPDLELQALVKQEYFGLLPEITQFRSLCQGF